MKFIDQLNILLTDCEIEFVFGDNWLHFLSIFFNFIVEVNTVFIAEWNFDLGVGVLENFEA